MNCAWPPSRHGGTTQYRATALATCAPWSERMTCRHRSIPAARPADVSTSPSSTKSTFSSTFTRGCSRRSVVGELPVGGCRATVEQARPRRARMRPCRWTPSGCPAGWRRAPPSRPASGHRRRVPTGIACRGSPRCRRPPAPPAPRRARCRSRWWSAPVVHRGRTPRRRTAAVPSSSTAAPNSVGAIMASKPTTGGRSRTATRCGGHPILACY